MENRGRKLIFAILATIGIVYGVLPVAYHYTEVALVEDDIGSLLKKHGTKGIEELQGRIVESLSFRQIKMDPAKIFIKKIEGSSEVHVLLRYRSEVKILWFTRTFPVEVDKLVHSYYQE